MCFFPINGKYIIIEKNNPDALWKIMDEEYYRMSIEDQAEYLIKLCSTTDRAEYYIEHQLEPLSPKTDKLNKPYLIRDWLRMIDWNY